MSSNDEILAQFIAVTQCPQDQAQRYLEASNWNMDTAMECFYDDGASTSHVPSHQNIPITNLNDNSAREGDSARATGSGYASDDDDSLQMAIEKSMQSATVSQDSSKSTKKQPPQSSRFGTIASLQKEDDSSDEEGQAFYAGGSERSGQQIIGPPKPKLPVDKDKEVENVFKAARDQGAKEADDSHSHDDHQHKQKAFGGVGYTLGDESTPSRSLDTTPSTSSSNRNQANNALQIPILFYKNGFTVDDGELRRFEENRAFIDSITRGEVPEELRKLTTGGRQVEVRLEDHRGDEYVPKKATVKPFGGQGYMLGTPTPNLTGTATNSPIRSAMTNTTAVASPSSASNEQTRIEKLAHDRFSTSSTGETMTTIRLRLPDFSSPLKIQLGNQRTLRDVRQFIRDTLPQLQQFEFIEPPATKIKVEDETKSILEAKLTNAMIVVRKM